MHSRNTSSKLETTTYTAQQIPKQAPSPNPTRGPWVGTQIIGAPIQRPGPGVGRAARMWEVA